MAYVQVNIGVRHVLAVYPAILLLAGIALHEAANYASRAKPAVYCGCILAMACISSRTFPQYEEFFNSAAGGPRKGWKWLADSNLEFGQDAYYVKHWLALHPGACEWGSVPPRPGLTIVRAPLLVGINSQSRTAGEALRRLPVKEQPTPALLVFDIPVRGEKVGTVSQSD
jgi:hypothetical protein